MTVNLFAQDSSRRRPFFTTAPVTRVAAGAAYRYKLSATDSLGNAVALFIDGLPAWLSYNPADHSLSGKTNKPGQYPVHITATGPFEKSMQHFMLTVYNAETSKILCLGNSLTNGTSHFNSYRRELWLMLHRSNYNFDLIGSWNKHHMGGAVPDDDFDTDHEGHSGWTVADMFHPPTWDSSRGNLYRWLTVYSPDIVLIELGTNDVFQCVPTAAIMKNIDRLTTALRAKNKSVKICIAQIPPLGAQWADKKLCGDSVAYKTAIFALNKEIAHYAEKTSTKASAVIAVDQFTGVVPATDMYDDIHPNASGEKIMAARWFAAIRKYLKKLP